MTTIDIVEQVKELYDVEVSTETVSNVTNRILPLVYEWQNRVLENINLYVFMDTFYYKVRKEKQIVVKVAYVVIA